jgi:hypothetical protein
LGKNFDENMADLENFLAVPDNGLVQQPGRLLNKRRCCD